VRRNRHAGVWARHGALGSVEGCDLSGNAKGWLEAEDGHRVRLRANVQ
jgi:hypothetical protein